MIDAFLRCKGGHFIEREKIIHFVEKKQYKTKIVPSLKQSDENRITKKSVVLFVKVHNIVITGSKPF